MTSQINLRMGEKLYSNAKEYADSMGYENLQDFIREIIRQKVFEDNTIMQKELYLAKELDLLAEEKNLYGDITDIDKIIKKKENGEV